LRPGAGVALAILLNGASPVATAAVLIRGGTVFDGTGARGRRADVLVDGDRIVAVGRRLKARKQDRVIAAKGLAVAPGFIDLHNHADRQVFEMPEAVTQVAQGITTVLVGVDGGGAMPVADFLGRLERQPAAVNVATMVGHGAVRAKVMGEDYRRPARPDEVAAMTALVARGMEDGAFGLSSGLEYDPGFYSTTDELVALAAAAGARGGFYASHVRNEADDVMKSLAEVVEIGRRARLPVHVSHIKLGTVGVWGRAEEALEILHAARELDVTADWYPYAFWSSTTYVLMPGGRDWEERAGWAKGLADVGGAGNVLITDFPPDASYAGHTLEEVAAREQRDPVDVLMDIVRRGNASILCTSMQESDLEAFLRDPLVMIGSDGGIRIAHPRGAGAYPRVLGRYVRERRVIPLETAIQKMTGRPAQRLGLRDRGLLAAGMKADLVVFDPARVIDRSTAADPQAPPEGIAHVFVNGEAVIENGQPTRARPGRVLYGPAAVRSLPGDVRHEQPLHGTVVPQVRLDDLLHVVEPHLRVPDVVRIDGDRDPAATVLQAIRAVHDHTVVQAALAHELLEAVEDGLGTLWAAGPLRVVRRPDVEADEHVTLRPGHEPILEPARL
jgi:N-acyl-D-amino-acid deacylase